MKKKVVKICLSLTLLVGLVWGCSLDNTDDNSLNFTYELVPVTEVNIPDTVIFNEKYKFKISYEKPSNCHSFSGFDYSQNLNERKISVVSSVIMNNDECSAYDEPKVESQTLNFLVKRHDYYVFKFWKGKDSIGEPKYLTKRVTVADRE